MTRDGVPWTYAYGICASRRTTGYLYDRLTVTGPNGFNQSLPHDGAGHRNVVTGHRFDRPRDHLPV